MKLSTALRLGRVAALPTVASNVLAAVALAGVRPSWVTIATAFGALALMQVGGSYLLDAFERDRDRELHADRPIATGEAHAATVFDAGFTMLVIGLAGIVVLALATGTGGRPIVAAGALTATTIYYVAHPHGRYSPLLLAACRTLVYMTAALLVRPDLCIELVAGATVSGLCSSWMRLTAGIALIDALFIASIGRGELALAALVAFAASAVLRRFAP